MKIERLRVREQTLVRQKMKILGLTQFAVFRSLSVVEMPEKQQIADEKVLFA